MGVEEGGQTRSKQKEREESRVWCGCVCVCAHGRWEIAEDKTALCRYAKVSFMDNLLRTADRDLRLFFFFAAEKPPHRTPAVCSLCDRLCFFKKSTTNESRKI